MKRTRLMLAWALISLVTAFACSGGGDDDSSDDDAVVIDDASDDTDADDHDDSGDDLADDATDDSTDDVTDDAADDAADDTNDDTAADDTGDDDTGSGCESPQLLFTDDFDSYTAGGPPGGLWESFSSNHATIYDAEAHSAPNSLRLWSGVTDLGRYIVYSPISLDIPPDTCDVYWVEMWAKVFWGGDDAYFFCVFNAADDYSIYDCFIGGGETWQLAQVKVNLTDQTLDYYLDGAPYGNPVSFEHTPDTVYILAVILSDGQHFSPGTLLDDVRIYDDGYPLM